MERNRWIKYLDYFFIARPMLFFPGWNTLIAGYLVARHNTNFIEIFYSETFTWYLWENNLFIMMFAFAAGVGGNFILNQLQDFESDRYNKKLFLISKEYVSRRNAIIECIFLIVISFIVGYLVSYQAFLLLALGTLAGYFYNYKPFRYKNRPIMGLLINTLAGWIAFGMGWIVINNLNIVFVYHCLPYLFLNTGLCLLTTIPDMEGDRIAKKNTIPIRFSINISVWITAILYLLSVLSAVYVKDYFILTIDILILYWMVLLFAQRSESAAIKTVKMTIFLFSVLICFKLPLYFILMISIFYFTKYYYKERFQFDYPNFRGE